MTSLSASSNPKRRTRYAWLIGGIVLMGVGMMVWGNWEVIQFHYEMMTYERDLVWTLTTAENNALKNCRALARAQNKFRDESGDGIEGNRYSSSLLELGDDIPGMNSTSTKRGHSFAYEYELIQWPGSQWESSWACLAVPKYKGLRYLYADESELIMPLLKHPKSREEAISNSRMGIK